MIYCTASQESQEKVDSLTEQLYSIAQQRDTISLQLNTVLEEKDQLQHQVTNLQMVLEEFQKGVYVCVCLSVCTSVSVIPLDHSSKLSSSEEMFHKELAVITEQRDKLQEQLQDTKVLIICVHHIYPNNASQVKLTQALCSAENLEDLRAKLDSKNASIKDMKQQS